MVLGGKMKTFMVYFSLSLLSFAINFLIFNFSFNTQATPYMSEDQRIDSAMLMLKTTVPAFLLASVFMAVLFWFFGKSQKNGE